MKLAYLDATSGSMIVQAVVAGVAGVGVFAKLFWRRLSRPFRHKDTTTQATAAQEPVATKGDER
jgi:hypothetical protein